MAHSLVIARTPDHPVIIQSPRRLPRAPIPPSLLKPWNGTVPIDYHGDAIPDPSKTAFFLSAAKREQFRKNGGVLAVTMLLFVLILLYQDSLTGIGGWGYLAVFLLEAADSANPFIPTPAHAYTLATSMTLSPFLVGFLAVVGSTLGETTGYMFGVGSQGVVKKGRLYRYVGYLGELSKRWIVACFAAIPIPIYLAGVWAGVFGMSYRRFLIYSMVGKVGLFGLIGLIGQFAG